LAKGLQAKIRAVDVAETDWPRFDQEKEEKVLRLHSRTV
jgi:hypothetical protein